MVYKMEMHQNVKQALKIVPREMCVLLNIQNKIFRNSILVIVFNQSTNQFAWIFINLAILDQAKTLISHCSARATNVKALRTMNCPVESWVPELI